MEGKGGGGNSRLGINRSIGNLEITRHKREFSRLTKLDRSQK